MTKKTAQKKKAAPKKRPLGRAKVLGSTEDLPQPMRRLMGILQRSGRLKMWEKAAILSAVYNQVIRTPCIVLCRLFHIDHDAAHAALDEMYVQLGFEDQSPSNRSCELKPITETIQ